MEVEEGDESMSEQGQDEMMPGTGDEDGEQSQHQQRQDGGPGRDRVPLYQPYTVEFDEIVEAEDLCDPDELNRLRHHLDQQLANLQGIIGRLANRLQRACWRSNRDRGSSIWKRACSTPGGCHASSPTRCTRYPTRSRRKPNSGHHRHPADR